jgi:hypothetical protein
MEGMKSKTIKKRKPECMPNRLGIFIAPHTIRFAARVHLEDVPYENSPATHWRLTLWRHTT